MYCTFCEEKLLRPGMPPGSLVTIDPNLYAHKNCASQALVGRKMFGEIKLDNIPSIDLHELKNIVTNEINARDELSM